MIRRSRARGLVGLLVAVATTLSPSGGTSVAGAAATDRDRAAIQSLLDRRAEAVLARDRDAFLATIATDSRAFVARQRRFFRHVGDVPLASYRLVVAWDRYGDLVRPSDAARYPGAEVVSIPLTEERYRIEGFDRAEAVEDTFFTFVKERGEWLIAEDTDLDDLTLFSGRKLWDFGAIEARRSRHFLLLDHPCVGSSCPAEHDYLGLAEQGLSRVARYWRDVPRRTVMLVPETEAELGRLIQATFDLDNFVAFAYSTVDLDEGVDYTGHRVILNPDAFRGRPSDVVLQILAHEMLHVATRDAAGPFIPIFVDEGWADHVGNDANPAALAFFNSEVAAGLFSGELPEDYEFTVGSGTDIYRSYQESQSAVRYFVGRWGRRAFVRFYRHLGRQRIAPGTVRYHLDRSLKKVIGLDYDAFQRDWADSIT
ncbi:MAG: hypothetical protein M3238_03375 [Actinomycetota bacterium]|nr:hypothetical protein [Actinomycetota bacterium]